MSQLCFRNVEVEGALVDVGLANGRIVSLESASTGLGSGSLATAVEVVEGHGSALLPGLHDHHLHLMALAAAADSVDCSPDQVSGLDELGRRLRSASQDGGWVRAVNYHESVAGDLDRDVLDRLAADCPVRVQHSSGGLWTLNSAALELVGPALVDVENRLLDGVETNAEGRLTGRLYRLDAVLATAVPRRKLDMAGLGQRLRRLGLTGVTDATPDLPPETVSLLAEMVADGSLPLRVTLLGADRPPTPLSPGPRKLLLHDHDLPDFDTLAASIRRVHLKGRPVAVHCVSRESLVLTLAVLEEVGPHSGDRIEHAGVVPPEIVPTLRRLGLCVVTQPDFLRSRGERYRRYVDPDDLAHLYPYASLLAGGVHVAASSDAPFGEVDPWQVIASAVRRTTSAGVVLGGGERVSALTALGGYLSAADDPGGPARRLVVGQVADLVLLDAPLAQVLASPSSERVRLSVLGEHVVRRY